MNTVIDKPKKAKKIKKPDFTAYEYIVNAYGKEPSNLTEYFEAVRVIIEKNNPGLLIGLAMKLSYDPKISNSHSCPKNGVENWRGESDKPKSYPGYKGVLEYRVSRYYQGFSSDIFKPALIKLNGGSGVRNGIWDTINNASKDIKKFFNIDRDYEYPYHLRSSDHAFHIFLDDFPLLKEYTENHIIKSTLTDSLFESMLYHNSWTRPDVIERDKLMIEAKKTLEQKPSKLLIGIVGVIGSGKSTLASRLVKTYKFKELSFASSLKYVVSVIFGWDINMVNGLTESSRIWRDQIDEWWATKLNMPDLTPRKMLQLIGTDLFRNYFDDNIWIYSLMNKLTAKSNINTVISDCRFKNEIDAIKQSGGIIIRVKRDDPDWLADALIVNNKSIGYELSVDRLSNIHPSEYSWVGNDIDYEIDNSGSIEEFHEKIDILLLEILKNK